MSQQSQLKSILDTLAAKGSQHLRKWELKQAVEASTPSFWRFAWPVPVLVLVLGIAGLISPALGWPFGVGVSLVLAIIVPLLILAVVIGIRYSGAKPDRRMALALFDRKLGLKDRLQAADEFISTDTKDGFELAAVEDATTHARRALDIELEPPVISRPSFSADKWHEGLIALLVLFVGLWVGQQSWTAETVTQVEGAMAEAGPEVEPFEPPAQEERKEIRDTEDQLRQNLNKTPRLAQNERRPETAPGDMDAMLNPSTAKMSSGKPGARPQEAKKSQSSSSESGASGQSQENKKKKDAELKAKPKKNKPKKDKEQKEDKEKPSSGVTGGKGGSSGSKSSASDQQGADNKAAQDQDEDQTEGDPEDEEDEEQKAGSSSKPLINQKKAPVNRSLTPSGLGEGQENPDANGRSGPGGLKKTRGVAAMLLGTPLPDRLNGQPNPGRVKVQREKAQPEEQNPDPASAGDRMARDEAIGTVAHPELLPWMRDLVRKYFLQTRQAQAPENPGVATTQITTTDQETES